CPAQPACTQVYNMFPTRPPLAARLEPLLLAQFSHIAPVTVSRYHKFPLGDGSTNLLVDAVQSHPSLFMSTLPLQAEERRPSEASVSSQTSQASGQGEAIHYLATVTNRWWGAKRIDYALYCPEALTAFPSMTLPYLFHASYWESTDAIAFILRQVVRVENVSIHIGDGEEVALFSPTQPRERWLKRRTAVKIKNMTANHRAADSVTLQNTSQSLTGRFMYGPLDMVALTGEKVDVYIMLKPPAGEWVHFDTIVTNSHGRIHYSVPKDRMLGCGIYPVKMIVRGDHTSADSFLSVILPKTECVVFSIDGSFTASVSIMGKDPKVRAGAVDVVRHWQELGYLIVYVTGRPDMQKHQVVSWLAQHNFPHGVVSFCDGLSHDPLRQKANYLRNLVQEVEIVIHAAYGSVKDIPVYTSLGLENSHLFIVGRPNKKNQHQAQFITEGYAVHLSHLLHQPASQPAKGGACMVLHKGCFGLPGQAKGMIRPMTGRQATIQPGSAQAAPSSQ
ncbi:LOW QUALITY PROTEIN: membrane-associated phosphatidylinositol transfer protein 3-like, partial [Branchiostoma floridae x Branchiostoma japonicum]